MNLLTTVRLSDKQGLILARARARQVAALTGFANQDQIRIATAVSEIARNAIDYGGGGTVEFAFVPGSPPLLQATVRDQGSGIADLEAVLLGRQISSPGKGRGIAGARRLMDGFEINSSPGSGTVVVLSKELPSGVVDLEKDAQRVAVALLDDQPTDLLAEMQLQNRELLQTMDELRERREQFVQINSELEDTNRGVVALYAELDQRAEDLRRASELKSSFLSNMSHEFRTPLNAIHSLTGLLLGRADGDLTDEQETQVQYIRKSAAALTEMVNDLLDLAKVEAGIIDLRPEPIVVNDLFGALRGMLKPLLADKHEVALIFDDDASLPLLISDEGKVSQILRNFISNSIKFTLRGTVRISAAINADDGFTFCVADSGIGIAPDDLDHIFIEFTQIAGPLHKTTKGTGLGLPLSKKLAELLGGKVGVESELGVGSRFYLTLPRVCPGYQSPGNVALPQPANDGIHEIPVVSGQTAELILVIDDNEADRYIMSQLLLHAGLVNNSHQIVEALNGEDGIKFALNLLPKLIVLDYVMPGTDGPEVLRVLKANSATASIPVVICTSKALSETECADLLALGAAVVTSKNTMSPHNILMAFRRAFGSNT